MVHIFVSYSRRDSELVGRIVDRLESSGHDVWIDTDDIVGSDRWRSSVAEAIAAADVVVLMISPASMTSRSVEREITVASEEARRIVPVEIEQAEVAIGLQYDLAGIQRISFVDRPFEDGVAQLLAAVVDAPALLPHRRADPEPHAPATTGTSRSQQPIGVEANGGRVTIDADPSAPRRRRTPHTVATVLRWAVIGAVVIAVAIAAVRLRGGDGTEAAPETTSADPPAEAEPVAATALTDVPLDTSVWFAGYTVAATHARLDPADGTVSLDVRFTNDQYAPGNPCDLFLDHVALVFDGQRSILWADGCTRLTPGTSTRITLDATLGAEAVRGHDLGDAVVELGAPDQHRATIPLDGSPAASERPTDHVVSGTLTGEVTGFVVEHVEVVPATCSSWSPLTFPPGRADEMAVIVSGTATSTGEYPLGYGKARLTLPNGSDLASNNLAGVIHVLDPGVPERDIRACFNVPTPIGGEYHFTAAADGDEPFPEPISFVL